MDIAEYEEIPKSFKGKPCIHRERKMKTTKKTKEKEFVTMTEAEFMAEGKRLFGDDCADWRFQCPICGNIQGIEDFRQYKEVGATPESAYQQCIGRYQEDPYLAFGENKKGHKKTPCDYASGGLFRIGNTVKLDNGKEICVFPFMEVKK